MADSATSRSPTGADETGVTPIGGLRERKRAENRQLTAEVAWRLFVRHGYDEVTVGDICAAADIAPRTFHRYFPAKEDVVAEPIRRMSAILLDRLAAAPASVTDAEAMRLGLRDLGSFTLGNRDWLTALRTVIRGSHQLRVTGIAVAPDQEHAIIALLAARRPDATGPDWRRRRTVACAVATFQIWYDDYFAHDLGDPLARLDEMLQDLP